jgi:putative glutamine amidotransferase
MTDPIPRRVAISFGDPAKLRPYEAALRAVGLEPVPNPESLEDVQGLLLTGGTDVNPELYDETQFPETDNPDLERDAREARYLGELIDRGLPTLAICRGLQMLNVALGGSLVQQLPNSEEHRRRTADPSERVHDIVVSSGTLLSEVIGAGVHPVNSRHHQAIARLAPALRVAATAPNDGVIEAVELPGMRFVLGVQWHPEDRIRCEADLRLFEGFARAVTAR